MEKPLKKTVHYYPFGLKHKGYNNATSANGNSLAQKFKYNGVEFEESLGLNSYETDFRGYDASIGRFATIDPLAELNEQLNKSPYAFAWNNPIFYNDPLGLCPECPNDATEGQIYESKGGETYLFEDGDWVRSGGTLDEISISTTGSSGGLSAIGASKVSTDPDLGFIPGPGGGGGLISPKPTPVSPPAPIETTPKGPQVGPIGQKVGLLFLWWLFVQPTNVNTFHAAQLNPNDSKSLPRNESAVLRVQFQQKQHNLSSESAYNSADIGVTTAQAQFALTMVTNDMRSRYKKIFVSPQAQNAIKKLRAKIESIKPNGIIPGTRTTLQEKFWYQKKEYRFDVESIIGHNLRQ